MATTIYSDNDFSSEISAFKATNCKVLMRSRVLKAPIESGVQTLDNKVLDPIEIKITGDIEMYRDDAKSAVAKIKKMFENRKAEFYSLTCRDGAFNNLILQDAPHSESEQRFDIVSYELTFVRAIIYEDDGSVKEIPADECNTDAINDATAPVSLEEALYGGVEIA